MSLCEWSDWEVADWAAWMLSSRHVLGLHHVCSKCDSVHYGQCVSCWRYSSRYDILNKEPDSQLSSTSSLQKPQYTTLSPLSNTMLVGLSVDWFQQLLNAAVHVVSRMPKFDRHLTIYFTLRCIGCMFADESSISFGCQPTEWSTYPGICKH